MIKFFRKIRKSLLSENNFSKYLLYAIGEIILVVIGILIALQINNYSEQQKGREQEIILLQNLSNNVALDIKQIESNSKKSSERLDRLNLTMRLIKSKDSVKNDEFLGHSFEFLVDNYFRSNSGIFDEAVSSGKMGYIQNLKLSQSIFDYYRNAKESLIDGTARQITDEIITPLLVESVLMNKKAFGRLGMEVEDIANLEELDITSLRNNKDFWRMCLLKFGSNSEQLMRWGFMKQDAEELKSKIDQELEKLKD
ncbi:hypothetical protein MTsPCn9_13050 [Croceitalea sp. MTPC9]|uniref:DUF6090 family protein n=1 Tax=unclassified Croceitalea TaxID=2632280 RepID=UPI002B3F25A2|nr:hypothetical protein MTsPCn6_16080 [Croceitalea sp. MTPC6]GMN16369.1 hypothetical protein MTsPCn9_13050 [Croceitalea sp. MTPC9]